MSELKQSAVEILNQRLEFAVVSQLFNQQLELAIDNQQLELAIDSKQLKLAVSNHQISS